MGVGYESRIKKVETDLHPIEYNELINESTFIVSENNIKCTSETMKTFGLF